MTYRLRCSKRLYDAYATFRHPEVAPLVQIENDLWIQELFHGPTLAFKDLALQVVGRLFDHVLAERSDRVTIVGATSGDTGSAAIDAVKSVTMLTSSSCTHVAERAMCSDDR